MLTNVQFAKLRTKVGLFALISPGPNFFKRPAKSKVNASNYEKTVSANEGKST